MFRLLPKQIIALLCVFSTFVQIAKADEEPQPRRYDAGPLTLDDFCAPVPSPLPRVGYLQQVAQADSDIRFAMQYEYQRRPEEVEAKLTEIDIYGEFLPKASWISRADKASLDHEQGHFDITQIYALQANLEMNRRLIAGKTLVGRGKTVRESVADLEMQIKQLLKPVYDRAAVAQKEYDKQTGHGTHTAVQKRHRQRQINVLTTLNHEQNQSRDNVEPKEDAE